MVFNIKWGILSFILFSCSNFVLDELIDILNHISFVVPRPHLFFEAQLVAGKTHEFGPVICPEPPNSSGAASGIAYGRQRHEAEMKYPQRMRRLNIFPPSKTEVMYPIADICVVFWKKIYALMITM